MRKPLIIFIVLVSTMLFGCKKEDDSLRQILTSKSWEEIEVGMKNTNSFKNLYKVTFEVNGEFELVFRQLGVMPGDSSNSLRIDTLTGNYELFESENTIKFKPIESIVSETDSSIIVIPCDTIYYCIGDWHILEFNKEFLEIQGENPDSINKSTCSFVSFLGHYRLKPYISK